MKREELKDLKVAVLVGGWSDEREISIQSGTACRQALLGEGFTKVEMLDVANADFIQKISHGGYDVAFIAMHGRYGEDGCVQGLLEVLHIPYTFSNVFSSAVAMQKEFAKSVYQANGIPTPQGIDVDANKQLSEEEIDEVAANLGFPLFVKPAGNGSSFGVTRVESRDALNGAIETAGQGGGRVLIEECIEGMEITVPVLGNHDPQALPIVEIVTGAEFYDLKVKYEPSSMHHVIPARLEPGVYAKAQELAVKAHEALGCLGCSRSDFIVTADGTPVILETNTIPGMTENSLLPDSARHGGIEFGELCCRFVELALEAAEEKSC